jgi:hypothetical protein
MNDFPDRTEATGSWSFAKRCCWLVPACLAVGWQGPDFVRGLRPAVTETRVEVFDFLQDWLSARNYWAGQPVYGSQEEALRRHLNSTRNPNDPRNRFFNEVNAHPPTAVLLVLPLAWLDYPTAFLMWSLLSLALGGLSLWLVVRLLRVAWSPWSLLPLVALLLVCNPFRQQMHEGQWSLLVLFLLVATWAAARSGYAVTAGVLLALATAVKLIPAFVFVYFAWRREWRTVLAGLVSLALLTGLTVAVLGVETCRSYVETIPSLAIHDSSWVNASLTGFWSKLFATPTHRYLREPLWTNPALAEWGAWLSCVLVTLILLGTLRKMEPADVPDLGYGLTLIALLLVSPVTWEHYFLLLLVPLAVIWQRLPTSVPARIGFGLIVTLLWIQPRWLWNLAIPGTWLYGTARPWQTLTVLSLQFYALVALFALGVGLAYKASGKEGTGPGTAGL